VVKVGDVIPRESTDADSKLKRASNDAFAQCISSNNGCLREKTDGTNAVLLSTIKCILLYGKYIFRFLKTKSLTQQIHETDSKAGNGNTVKEFQTVLSHRSQLSKIWPAMSMKTHGAMVVLIGQLKAGRGSKVMCGLCFWQFRMANLTWKRMNSTQWF
jgi:hypothetical protein